MRDGDDTRIKVAALDRENVPAWEAFVNACPEATFYHRAGWKRVIESSLGHPCHFLYAEADGAVCGVLPLVHVKSRMFGNSLISTGFTVGGGPAVDTPEAMAALDRRALEIADELDVDCIEYRSGSVRHPDWEHKADLYAGFRKSIGPDAEQALAAIPRKQRAMVRKGIKAGLISGIDEDVDRLHHVYATSVRNLGTPVFAKSYFRKLMDVFAGDIDVVTVTANGAAIASVMNFYFRDQVLPYYGGGVAEARRVAGNDFMYWEVMRRAMERGCRMFDFGRSKRGTGAFAFKKNWGFEPASLDYEYKLRNIGHIPDINPMNPKYRLFIAGWKRLPLAVTKLIGPRIVRNLG
jgi:FemAB-related protein (PEP-CTERM system-associated)